MSRSWNDEDQILGTEHRLLTAAEEVELATLARAGDTNARDALAAHNLRLVVSIAERYQNHAIHLHDLVQEGCVGLLRAVDKYDHRKGNRFSTYATWWIRQAITRAIADHGRTVRLPVHLNEHIARLARAQQRHIALHGVEPTEAELAAAIGCTVEKLRSRRAAARVGCPVSLDAACTGNGDDAEPLYAVIADERTPDAVEVVAAGERRALTAQLLAELSERQRDVLTRRYGLGDDAPQTLDQIGRALGMTRERARQIEAEALKRLRPLVHEGAMELLEAA